MYINKQFIINVFIAFLPLALILGNLIVNINILLICFLGFFLYGKNIFFIKEKSYQYLIYIFFFYLILSTFANNFLLFDSHSIYKQNFIKSLFFLRFLLLFLIINKLIEKNELNFKLFFISCAFFSFLLATDVVIQIIFGKDLVGYKIVNNRPSGFFGNENIAGGYLQKFILFFIFFVAIVNKNKFIILLLFLLMAIPILLTGNRMPSLIYFFTIGLYFLLEKKFREILIVFIFICGIIFFVIKNPIIERVDIQLKVFFRDIVEIIVKAPKLFIHNYYNNEREIVGSSGYLVHFNSGIQVWKKNKIFGHGLKSFNINCSYGFNQTCNTHPHNYLIEIMVDMGLIGVMLIYSIFFLGFLNFKKLYFSKNFNKNKFILLPFFFITLFEFFPLRSTGSFFTTNNAVVIFTMLSIFVNCGKIQSSNFILNNRKNYKK